MMTGNVVRLGFLVPTVARVGEPAGIAAFALQGSKAE